MTESPHEAAVEAWRDKRYAALRREMGWLTLVGLGWLRDGVNRLGTGPDVDVRLPSGPALVGTVTLEGGRVVADGGFRHAGEAVADLELVDDEDGRPTLLEVESLRLCLIRRGGQLAIRTWDTDASARREFDGVDHWPVDPAWLIEARFEVTPGRVLRVPDVLGFIEEEPSPGEVVFTVADAERRLQALSGGDSGELWLVFGDLTNGAETYGGGRFLYTDPPAADGSVSVDFNRAYNPPCVFSPFATCPLPWAANRLETRIEAGERMYHPPSGPAGAG